MILHFFCLFLITIPLFCKDTFPSPWRTEPYAILLTKQAKKTLRPSEQRLLFGRIKDRLSLPVNLEELSDADIQYYINSFYQLFYGQESDASTKDVIALFKTKFSERRAVLNKNIDKTDIVAVLQELETQIDPSHKTNWTWVRLQLDSICLDLLPLISILESLEDQIEAINWYLFFIKGIRYPPLKEAMSHVDHYSSLAPILSSHQGICLGTTILYTAICQRLNIPIAVFTPPGHIFPAVPLRSGYRVIETTARGMAVPLKQYESIDQPTLTAKPLSTIFSSYLQNKGAMALQEKNFEKAYSLYCKAEQMSNEQKHNSIIAVLLLLQGKTKEAQKLAQIVIKQNPGDLLLQDIAENLLSKESAELLLEIFAIDDKDMCIEMLPKLFSEMSKYPTSFSLRYHTALLLLETHRIFEAQTLLNQAPRQPPKSLTWRLTQVTIASLLHNGPLECASTIELLRIALHEQKLPQELLMQCLRILKQNPDCKELATLLQEAIAINQALI